MISSRIASVAVALLALAGVARAEPGSPGCSATSLTKGERLEREIDVDGTNRTFILDVPETLQPGKPVPLLLDFHGFGHSAAGVWRVSGFRELGTRERFITVYPQGLGVQLLGRQDAGWEIFRLDGNRELAFVKKLLDQLEQQYCIDRQRVFATGFSNGAFLSHLLACSMGDRIAAIAPVGGGPLELACTPSRPVSVIIHHGRNDAVVPVDRARQLFETWKKLDGCTAQRSNDPGTCSRALDCRDGVSVVYCEGDGEHRWPPDATLRIWEFLQQHPMLSSGHEGAAAAGR